MNIHFSCPHCDMAHSVSEKNGSSLNVCCRSLKSEGNGLAYRSNTTRTLPVPSLNAPTTRLKVMFTGPPTWALALVVARGMKG